MYLECLWPVLKNSKIVISYSSQREKVSGKLDNFTSGTDMLSIVGRVNGIEINLSII